LAEVALDEEPDDSPAGAPLLAALAEFGVVADLCEERLEVFGLAVGGLGGGLGGLGLGLVRVRVRGLGFGGGEAMGEVAGVLRVSRVSRMTASQAQMYCPTNPAKHLLQL
jgi:hypothetical protein